LQWLWRRAEKRVAPKQSDVWCAFELTRSEVYFGLKTVVQEVEEIKMMNGVRRTPRQVYQDTVSKTNVIQLTM